MKKTESSRADNARPRVRARRCFSPRAASFRWKPRRLSDVVFLPGAQALWALRSPAHRRGGSLWAGGRARLQRWEGATTHQPLGPD
ncbi:hypothetical protein MHYP_G00250880 [Metynnis hypsauchen]